MTTRRDMMKMLTSIPFLWHVTGIRESPGQPPEMEVTTEQETLLFLNGLKTGVVHHFSARNLVRAGDSYCWVYGQEIVCYGKFAWDIQPTIREPYCCEMRRDDGVSWSAEAYLLEARWGRPLTGEDMFRFYIEWPTR